MWVGSFCIITGLNLCAVSLTKEKFGRILPTTLGISVLLVYFSQFIFHTFNVGLALLALGAVGGFAVTWKNFLSEKKFFDKYFSEGFWAFLVIILFAALLDSGRWFYEWDEFMHWGKMVREMIRLDSFYCVPENQIFVNQDYPPFAQLFEFIWCKFAFSKSDGIMTMGMHVLQYSFIMPWSVEALQEKRTDKSQKKIPLFVVCMLIIATVICLFDVYNIANTIYVDILLGIMLAYGLVFATRCDDTIISFVELVVLLCALALTKQSAILFVLMIVGSYAMTVLFVNTNQRTFKHYIINIIKVFFALGIPLIMGKIWENYVSKFYSAKKFALENFSVAEIIDIASGGGSDDQALCYDRFLDAIRKVPLTDGAVSISYLSMVIVTILVLVIAYINAKEIYTGKMLARDVLLIAGGSFAYAVGILCAYLFSLTGWEQTELASYTRFMTSFVLAEALFVIYIVIKLFSYKGIDVLNIKYLLVILVLAIVITSPNSLVKIMPQALLGNRLEYANRIAEEIMTGTEDGSKVVVIDSRITTNTYVNCYLDNRRIDSEWLSMSLADSTDDGLWETFIIKLSRLDYVYIEDVTDIVTERLGNYIDGEITASTLYKVTVDDEFEPTLIAF